jgi:hypothetical protein
LNSADNFRHSFVFIVLYGTIASDARRNIPLSQAPKLR